MPDQSVKNHSHLFHLSNQPLIHFSPEIIVYGSISLLFKSVYTSGCISSGFAIKGGSQFPIIIIISISPSFPSIHLLHPQGQFLFFFSVYFSFLLKTDLKKSIFSFRCLFASASLKRRKFRVTEKEIWSLTLARHCMQCWPSLVPA